MTRGHPERFNDMPGLHARTNRRLNDLERRPTTVIVATVDAGGAAWNSGNGAWLDPTTYTEWAELRVTNTVGGVSELYRCMEDGGGLDWVKVA